MARAADPIKARLAATHIVRTLRDAGHIAYFAGGCVRDGLLGLHPTDYDVATDATPKRVKQLFPRTAQVGAAFGVVLVHVAGHDHGRRDEGLVSVEVATFRSDGPYSDARRPDRVMFSNPRQDAERRDFTINALFLDPLGEGAAGDLQGTVIDFVGGVADLKARVLRAVGDPERRLAEDHLRALRAVRFAARLGFEIDAATAGAITRHAADLRGVSRERIGDEMRRMLSHPSRAQAMETIESLGLDSVVLIKGGVRSRKVLLGGLGRESDAMTALAAWMLDRQATLSGRDEKAWLSDHLSPADAAGARAAMCLSNDETDQLAELLEGVWAIAQRWRGMRVSQRKRLASRWLFGKCMDIVRAWDRAVADAVEGDVRRLDADGVGVNPPVLVTGDDLIADGMVPGPRFKGILDEVRDTQLEGGVRTKAEGMELARRLGVQR